MVAPQTVEINQVSTVMVIHLLHRSALPAASSASILAYSPCSPGTTADSCCTNTGLSWPCYFMASACLPPWGVCSFLTCYQVTSPCLCLRFESLSQRTGYITIGAAFTPSQDIGCWSTFGAEKTKGVCMRKSNAESHM